MSLSVVIAIVEHENKLLLIKRVRGDYIGYWGLPGGKVEDKEHLREAAQREIHEETGLDTDFVEYSGLISEIYSDTNDTNESNKHFLLHIVKLKTKSANFSEGSEGELKWFSPQEIKDNKTLIIPSDYLIIQEFFLASPNSSYFECKMSEKEGQLILHYFREAQSTPSR